MKKFSKIHLLSSSKRNAYEERALTVDTKTNEILAHDIDGVERLGNKFC